MKVGVILSVVVFSTGLFSTSAWDIAVAVKDTVQFLNVSGAVVGNVSEGMSEVHALAYNAELRRMYFSDNEREEGSVFELSMPAKMAAEGQKVSVNAVVSKQAHEVKGIAYDPMTGILYWSNGAGHSILWVQVGTTGQAQAGQPLLQLGDQIPMGIAIDTCKRYLYWTNCNSASTIERSLLDGSERQTLISSDLHLPYSVVVDQSTDRLYWADERSGYQFRIESATMDGNDRKVVIHGSHHQPFALAVSAGSVFWADNTHSMVWRVPLDGSITNPLTVQMYESTPKALASAQSGVWIQDKCNSITEPKMKVIPATVTKIDPNLVSIALNSTIDHKCHNNGLWQPDRQSCNCLPGYSGTLCEINECTDYCVRGVCNLISGQRSCQCLDGFTGERCETSVCHNFCVTGMCSIDITGQPQCHCKDGFSGDRCEVNFTQQQEQKDDLHEVCKAFCKLWSQSNKDQIQPFDVCSCAEYEVMSKINSEWSHDYTIAGLLVFCFGLLVVVGVLGQKVFVLRKRPRIKKRIIVNKSVTPLTCRPNQPGGGGEQCEITIENCCNMNICETPCFEPDFRQPDDLMSRSNNRSSKDEKKTLLGNMELPPDDLY